MASAISSRAPKALRFAALREPLNVALTAGPVPLLALRLPEFERIAWRDGKPAAKRLERRTTRAFLNSSGRLLRTGDLVAHDPGSDVYAIAMSAPARSGPLPSAANCRMVLERVAAALSLPDAGRVESGWTVLQHFDAQTPVEACVARALERGARERERYEFFAAIGHELRTPLTSIRGYLETVIESEMDAATARRFLQTAQREALRMGRLIDGMFEFSLLDLSAGALLGRSCEIREQIESACEIVRPLAQSRRITVSSGACEAVEAAMDPDACLQLLVNLIDNAVKYGRDGGIVRVEALSSESEVRVVVDDDGPGVSPIERESIFALRVRGAHGAARPGTGIGLAIVKMIVERAGGRICVGESPLGGARFEACLPRRAESEARAS